MFYYQYFQKFKENWRTIIIIVLIVVSISLVSSTFRTPLYRATTRVLVIQKTSLTLDMYKASQSAERLAILYAKIIKSSAFLKDVLNSGFPINKKYFSAQEKDLRKKWARMVDSRVSTDTSIIEINVYHPQKEEAERIAQAIIYVFSKQSRKYYNLGDDVNITLLDTPLVSEKPVKPSLLLNLILSFFIGLVISGIFIAWKTKPCQKDKPRPLKEKEVSENIIDDEKNFGRYIGGLKIAEPPK